MRGVLLPLVACAMLAACAASPITEIRGPVVNSAPSAQSAPQPDSEQTHLQNVLDNVRKLQDDVDKNNKGREE